MSDTSVLSSDNSRLVLVGTTQPHFPQNVQANLNYTSVDVYKSDAADPLLNKNLTHSVEVVRKHVELARSTFSTVDKIVNDERMKLCFDIVNRPSILREWSEISETFEKVLVKSRDVAGNSALLIGDFLSTVIPYLLEEGELAEKQSELGEYRKTLEVGGERADLFATNFHEVSCRVRDFKQKWEAHSKETVKRLLIEVEKLQSDLAAVAKGVEETKQNFRSLLAQKQLCLEQEPQGSTKKILQGIVKEAKNSITIQKKSDPKVVKHTVEIVNKTNDLVVVWNFIHDDLGIIEGQLRICEKGHAFVVFKQRVEKLAVQYVTLMECLRSYASALAKAGKGSAQPLPNPAWWRRLLGRTD